MSIFHNGKEYGATKVINYSAAPDYNRGVAVTNIQDGNYQATDNGFLLIELQSQQSNVTKVSVIRSQNPITDNTGTEIASIVLSQYQYSETLIAQVMAREYYKLIIEGVGNPQVLSCVFYPYASTVPMKLTENITVEQVEGLGELAVVDDVDLATQTTGVLPVNKGGTGKNNLYNIHNAYLAADLSKFNFTTGTIKELMEKLPDHFEGTFLYVNKSIITDIPFELNGVNLKIIKLNQFLQASTVIVYRENGFETWQVYFNYPDFNTVWKKLRNFNGSIPADLISPTVLTYTNSDGIWTETKLSDGTTMLEGLGAKFFNNLPINTMNSATIIPPKAVDYQKSTIHTQGILMTSIQPPEEGNYYTSAIVNTKYCDIHIINTSNKTALRSIVRWYFRGILK